MQGASMPDLVRPLRGLVSGDLPAVGGKAVGLGELIAGEFDVPDGFVVTTEAYRRALEGVADPSGEPDVGAIRHAAVPEEVAAAILAAYAALDHGVVAVRSSATVEDLAGGASAGQYDTVLGVDSPDEVLDAVRQCWASLWGNRARAYRAAFGIASDQVGMAVVVQRLVPADYAGVMFTANPVTGARDEVVIDSSPGLGEAVVSGMVTPAHAVLDATGRIVTRRDGHADVVVLEGVDGTGLDAPSQQRPTDPAAAPGPRRPDDETLVRLAEMGRRVAATAGRPMDIEWASVGGRLVLLQSRPMTALPPPQRRLSRVQRQIGPVLVEMLPRRPTPLELTAWLKPVLFPFVDRMYAAAAGLRVAYGEAVPADDFVMTELDPPRPRPTWRTPARAIRGISRSRAPATWDRDPRARDYDLTCRELSAFDPTAASFSELVALPGRVGGAMRLFAAVRGEYQTGAAVAMARLALVLAAVRHSELLDDVWAGATSVTSSANAALAAVADLVRADPSLSAAFRTQSAAEVLTRIRTDPSAAEVRDRVETFLATYGHRETTSIMLLHDPTWGEDPKTVISLIGVLVPSPGAGEETPNRLDTLVADMLVRRPWLGRRLARTVAAARAGIAAREGTHLAATRLMPVMRRTLNELGRRLAARGWVEDPSDVWYLTWDEVSGLPDPANVASPAPVADLTAIARGRRDRLAELAVSPLVAGPSLYPGSHRAATNALVRGVGAGGGSAEGAVRVIHGPREFDLLEAGDVLVCPVTNPSWTPLFARVAAVVVDHGGISSHAAIVAREYGIPAVLGCMNATTILTTGQRVVVDGDRGLVTPPQRQHAAAPTGAMRERS